MKGLLARLGLLSRKMRTGFFLGLFILFSVFSSILFHLQFDLLDIESLQYDEGAIDTAFDWRFKMPDASPSFLIVEIDEASLQHFSKSTAGGLGQEISLERRLQGYQSMTQSRSPLTSCSLTLTSWTPILMPL